MNWPFHLTPNNLDAFQALVVASHGVQHWPATIAVLEPQENYVWRGGLL